MFSYRWLAGLSFFRKLALFLVVGGFFVLGGGVLKLGGWEWLSNSVFGTKLGSVLGVMQEWGGTSSEQNPQNKKSTEKKPQVLGVSLAPQQLVFRVGAVFEEDINARNIYASLLELQEGLSVGGDSVLTGALNVEGSAVLAGPVQIDGEVTLNADVTGEGVTIDVGEGEVFASNLVYSLQGEVGELELSAGDGITIDGLTITNDDGGSAQAIFKKIAVSGQGTVEADGNTDTLTLAAGTGVTITSDTGGDKLTWSVSSSDLNVSGWTDGGTTVALTTSTDNVGIGTTTATSKFHLVGDAYIDGNLSVTGNTTVLSGFNNSGGGITNAGAITGGTGLTSSGTITFSGLSTGVVQSSFAGVLSSSALNLAGGSSYVTGALPATNGGTGLTTYTTGDILYASATNTLAKLSIGSEGETLVISGGIPDWGTPGAGSPCATCLVTNPGSTQTITPTAATATGLSIRQASSGSVDIFNVTSNDGSTKYLRVDSSGNVQLGTNGATTTGNFTVSPASTDPIAIAPVAAGSNAFTGTITSADLTAARTWTFPDASGAVCLATGNCSGTSASVGGSGTANYLTRWSGTYTVTDSVAYDNGTNIGIGTTNPTTKLYVSGTGTITGATTIGGALTASSTLGVTGATTLSSTLSVTGATDLNSTLGVTGATTLSSTLDVTGLTTIGSNLNVNGTGYSYVSGNWGIGTTTPGAKLEVVGSADVKQVIIKANSTQTATVPIMQIQNSAGTELMSISTNADTGVWIGAGVASLTSSPGVSQILIGQNAGRSSTGIRNVFVGENSGRGNTTGQENVMVGYRSSYINTTGSYNAFFGGNAGFRNQTGSNNVMLGYAAGYNNTASYLGADNNVFIGYQSGYSVTDNQDGNVFLGYQSGYSETGSNKLYIENSSSTSPLIYGDFSSDIVGFNANVGIGTTSPSNFKLEVAGHVGPSADSTYNLGSASLAWANIYGDALYQSGNQVCDSSGTGCSSTFGNYWRLASGALSPVNNTFDLLLGSNATASAKFAFTNVNTGTPTATISGNTANVATYLTGTGELGTTERTTLALGGSGTGNITLNPGGSNAMTVLTNGNVGIGTTAPGTDLEVYAGKLQVGDLFTAAVETEGILLGRDTVAAGRSAPLEFLGSESSNGTGFRIQQRDQGGSQFHLIFSYRNNSSTWSDVAAFSNNGRFGVGDMIPDATFDVDGAANFDLSAGSSFTIDADTADATVDSLVLDVGTLTNGIDAANINLDVTGNTANDADTFTAINITASNNATDQTTDDNIYGVYIQDLGGTAKAGNEYGIYQAGTAWDYGLYVEDAALFNTDTIVNGNVGIGTTSPVGRLQISAAATGKALAILNETGDQNILAASASGTTVATLDRSGNLAIEGSLSDLGGTTLTINDDLQVSGDDILASTGVTAISMTGANVRVLGNLSNVGGFSTDGSATLGNATNDSITFTGRAASSLLPSADNTYNLGSSSLGWADIYSTNYYADTTFVIGSAGDCNNNLCLESDSLDTFFDFTVTNHNGGDFNMMPDGYVGIGTTNPGIKLDVETDAATSYVSSFFNDGNNANRYGLLVQAGLDDQTAAGPSTLIQFNDGDGGAVGSITFGSSATAYNTTSDQRAKQDITPTSMGITELMKIQISDFSFINDTSGKRHTGFIAQQLQGIFPEAVTAFTDGRYWQVDYGKVTPLIIKAVQDQQTQIKSLEAQTLALSADGLLASVNDQNQVLGASIETATTKLGVLEGLISALQTGASALQESFSTLVERIVVLETAMTKLQAIFNFSGSTLKVDEETAFGQRVVFEDADTAGLAVVSAHTTSVRVNFEKEYLERPVISLTPEADLQGYYLAEVSQQGFTIVLKSTLDQDVIFNWTAIAVKDARVVRQGEGTLEPTSSAAPNSNTNGQQPSSSSQNNDSGTGGGSSAGGSNDPSASPSPQSDPVVTPNPEVNPSPSSEPSGSPTPSDSPIPSPGP